MHVSFIHFEYFWPPQYPLPSTFTSAQISQYPQFFWKKDILHQNHLKLLLKCNEVQRSCSRITDTATQPHQMGKQQQTYTTTHCPPPLLLQANDLQVSTLFFWGLTGTNDTERHSSPSLFNLRGRFQGVLTITSYLYPVFIKVCQ